MRTRILAVLAGGSLAMLVLMATVFAPKAQAQPASRAPLQQAALAAPPSSVLNQTPAVSCTVATTQTVGKLGNQSFDTAFLLSNVGGLSLVAAVNVPPGTSRVVPTIPDYYYINVFAGNQINVTISPASAGGNYNLGLEVFDNNRSADRGGL